MLERDEPVNLLVMRPSKPPAATPRTPGQTSDLAQKPGLARFFSEILSVSLG